ncbi:MAG: putative aminohydrolase SsnA [Treponema sp.]|jgi:putative selenium metabolism protein SsnA|nr:putative aminohydrolase SsnA [Treponema sp.]
MLLIHNGVVVTRDLDLPLIEDGAVLIEGNKIARVGTSAGLEALLAGDPLLGPLERIDAGGRLVMPGYINAHTHCYSAFARGMPGTGRPATSFGEVLRGLWWRLDRQLDLEDVYYSAVSPMIDSIRSGVTSIIDHHAGPSAISGSLDRIAAAAALLGLRVNLCYEVSDRDGEETALEGIRENAAFAARCAAAKDDMLGALFGIHAQMTLGDRTLDRCIEAAAETGTGFHVHAAEGLEDVFDALARYGLRAVERLYRRRILSPKTLAVHCVHVTGEEIEMLRESGAAVIHNPQSNMSNAVGASPAPLFLKRGILTGLGTDGYTADMTESFKTAAVLHKHEAGIPSAAWAEPPKMFFENNRTIMNRLIKGETGFLREGALADIIIVDYRAPTPVNAANIDSHLLFGVSGRQTDTAIINGRVVMRRRELPGIDEEALLAHSRERARGLWNRI